MKSIKCSVDVLYTPSISTVLGEGVGVPFPPAKAIFAGIAILLGAVKNSSASYDTLVDLLASFENFLNRLHKAEVMRIPHGLCKQFQPLTPFHYFPATPQLGSSLV